MHGVEHDEAISICALAMQARRLLRRHHPSHLSPALTPRNDNSEHFQHSQSAGGVSQHFPLVRQTAGRKWASYSLYAASENVLLEIDIAATE
jgi:hypothetical protein